MSPSLDDLRAATARFAAALATADPDASVPSCPDWSVRDLVTHVGHVHAWASAIVASGAAQPRPEDDPGPDLARWYADRATALVDVLAAADPAAPCWNFADVDPTTGFWLRRQVHEVRMHHVDLGLAHGLAGGSAAGPAVGPAPDPALSADGVDETLTVFLRRMHDRGFAADLVSPVALVATDTGDVWTLTAREGEPPAVEGPAAGGGSAVADRLEGTAADLLLLLWKRADAGVRRVGDAAVLDRFLASRLTA